MRIIGYPRDKEGKPLPCKKKEEERTHWHRLRDQLRKYGWPEWRIHNFLKEAYDRSMENPVITTEDPFAHLNDSVTGATDSQDKVPIDPGTQPGTNQH